MGKKPMIDLIEGNPRFLSIWLVMDRVTHPCLWQWLKYFHDMDQDEIVSAMFSNKDINKINLSDFEYNIQKILIKRIKDDDRLDVYEVSKMFGCDVMIVSDEERKMIERYRKGQEYKHV